MKTAKDNLVLSKKTQVLSLRLLSRFGGFSLMLLCSGCARPISAVNPFPYNAGSSYAYDVKDIPDICFFPVDNARWNGEKVTATDWHKLTDFQKAMFINEYVENYYPDIEINGWDYLVKMNEAAESGGPGAMVDELRGEIMGGKNAK